MTVCCCIQWRKNILFVLPHYNSCPIIEKCCYLPILQNMSIGAAKITHNESFKDNNCSIAMLTTVVLFRRIHLRIFLQLSHFGFQPEKGLILAEVSESETERNTIRNRN